MLTDEERAVLELAAEPYRGAGWMGRQVRARFGWSTTRYYQVLDRLVRTPAALAHDPMTCRRVLQLTQS